MLLDLDESVSIVIKKNSGRNRTGLSDCQTSRRRDPIGLLRQIGDGGYRHHGRNLEYRPVLPGCLFSDVGPNLPKAVEWRKIPGRNLSQITLHTLPFLPERRYIKRRLVNCWMPFGWLGSLESVKHLIDSAELGVGIEKSLFFKGR